MRVFASLLAVCVAVLVSSCATTDVSSVGNPDYAGKHFQKIMVFAPFNDLQTRRTFESDFVQKLGGIGQTAISSMEVVPPIKQYSNAELTDLLSKAGIDAVMIVTLTDASTKQVYVPKSSSTTGTASVYGNTVYGRSQTNTYGGYYVSKPRVRFEVDLVDPLKPNVVIWKATTYTRGNAFADVNTIADSLSSEVANKLVSFTNGTK